MRKSTYEYSKVSEESIIVAQPPEKDPATRRIKGDQNYLTKLFASSYEDQRTSYKMTSSGQQPDPKPPQQQIQLTNLPLAALLSSSSRNTEVPKAQSQRNLSIAEDVVYAESRH